MRVLLQRVNNASVTVESELISSIGAGLLLFTGIHKDDDESKLSAMAQKVANLRIFPDERGRFHFSLLDTKGAALVVSQFTLFGDTNKGRRPDFFSAMEPERAEKFCHRFVENLKEQGVKEVQAGKFGAYMQVGIENDGPVTLMLEL